MLTSLGLNHQGVRQKLQAFEAFLDKNPEFQEKVLQH